MKKINFLLVLFSIVFLFSQINFAQHDYQIVQNFKSKVKQIDESIKSATTNDKLAQIKTQIDQLSSDYISKKDLLDKSLYPEDFNGSITKLNNALTLRQGDFGQITNLQTKISQLQTQLDTLNKRNSDLLDQLQQVQSQDKSDIARLNRIISELRYSLLKRDRLIMSMIDSLMPPSAMGNTNLTSSEQQEIFSKVKKMDMISNIKKSIDDNIKFLSASALRPNDLNSIKAQQQQFKKMWNTVGPQIISIYSKRHEDVKNLKDIDSVLLSWDNAIVQQAWNSINQSFAVHGIILNQFSNGEEFSQAVSSYINDEIQHASLNKEESKGTYKIFVDTVWNTNIKPNWIPFLMDNKLITEAQISTIDAKIAQWKNVAMASSFTWLYIIIPVLLIIIIVIIVMLRSSRKNKINIEKEI